MWWIFEICVCCLPFLGGLTLLLLQCGMCHKQRIMCVMAWFLFHTAVTLMADRTFNNLYLYLPACLSVFVCRSLSLSVSLSLSLSVSVCLSLWLSVSVSLSLRWSCVGSRIWKPSCTCFLFPPLSEGWGEWGCFHNWQLLFAALSDWAWSVSGCLLVLCTVPHWLHCFCVAEKFVRYVIHVNTCQQANTPQVHF